MSMMHMDTEDVVDNEERDTMRILIATDNHLGVWENDPVRKDDSFRTFEEIFEIAASNKVDMVLLGGDLFHHNKPSRSTIVKAMEILSRYCLNDKPVSFQVLSDQSQNFTTGRVNFENPNYNVGLPVFTIHGNHDDPGGTDNLSAVDILATTALVNYFGKIVISGDSGPGKLRISPVLLQKGNTKLALYGLGNLRDERLGNLFRTPNCVEWVRPVSTPEHDINDWVNLFVLHQNRISHTQSAKNYVQEQHLASFLDIVVWGHEHECIQNPWTTTSGGDFEVMQPGSSVATALSEGESRPKHVQLLEVCNLQYRIQSIKLETVRPFIWKSISLKDQQAIDPEEPRTIEDFLNGHIVDMISEALRGIGSRTPQLPLVRLRVDYTGFSTINTQRFGQKFVNKVANPHDIILWQKAALRRPRPVGEGVSIVSQFKDRLPSAEDQMRIEDLISAHLDQNLEVLPEEELTTALKEYVDKDERSALQVTIGKALLETQNATEEQRRRTANILQNNAAEETINNLDRDSSKNGVVDLCGNMALEGKKGERWLGTVVKEVTQQRRAEFAARQKAEELNAKPINSDNNMDDIENHIANEHKKKIAKEDRRPPGLISSVGHLASDLKPESMSTEPEDDVNNSKSTSLKSQKNAMRANNPSKRRALASKDNSRTSKARKYDAEQELQECEDAGKEAVVISSDEDLKSPGSFPCSALKSTLQSSMSKSKRSQAKGNAFGRDLSTKRSSRLAYLESSDEDEDKTKQEGRKLFGTFRTQKSTQGPLDRSQGPLRKMGNSQKFGALRKK